MAENNLQWRDATDAEVKSIQLDILKCVRDFCSENNIRFFLMYGTLLGAVRHNGYIPWDDDVDICMLKEDYIKFVRLFKEKQSRYIVHDRSIEKDFPYYFAKISDPGSKLCEVIDGKPVNLGINIDLFLLDKIPADENQRKKLFKKIYHIRWKMLFNTIAKDKKRVWYKQLFIRVMEILPWKKTYEYCWDIQRVVEKYETLYSDSVFEMLSPYGQKSILPLKYFSSTCNLPFEGEMFPAPAEYHMVLKHLYGDYMTPPPIEKQVTHHDYKAYLKTEEQK